jgi:hypothetical protein
LADDLLRRLDPDGETQKLLKAFRPLNDSKFIQSVLKLIGFDVGEIGGLLSQANQIVQDAVESTLLFVPLGWAPTGQAPHPVYAEALRVLKATDSIDQAETVLVRGWNDGQYLRLFLNPLRSFGREHGPLARIFHRRAELDREGSLSSR